MAKFRVYGIATASQLIGEYEANSPGEAKQMAENDDNGNWFIGLCRQCADEVEIGDVYEVQAEEV